jgi:VWFA-related protein
MTIVCALVGVLWLTAFACPALAVRQQREPATIRVNSRLVNVDVLVADRRTGTRVNGLRKEDFEVLDDGQRMEITHFTSSNDRDRPFALVLYVEVNNSIHPILPNLESKLEHALRDLEPADQVSVFIFDPYNFQMVQDLTGTDGVEERWSSQQRNLPYKVDKGKVLQKQCQQMRVFGSHGAERRSLQQLQMELSSNHAPEVRTGVQCFRFSKSKRKCR